MSIVDDVQQALDAYRSGGIGAAALAHTLLHAAHQLAPRAATMAGAQASADHDLIEVDGDRDDAQTKQPHSNLTDADRQARKSARAAARDRNVKIRAQTRNELIQLLGGDRPEQSRSALCASVTHRRKASRVLTEMLLDGTIIVVAPDVCALANNPQYQPKPKPHPDDNRIAAWLTDNEGASTDGDETIGIIRVRLWGSTVPPTPIPQGGGKGSNNRENPKKQKTVGTFMRYMGSKKRAQAQLKMHMPDKIDEYREPFMGSATTALAISTWHPEATVWVNDANPSIYHLWSQLQKNSDELVAKLLEERRRITSEDMARHYCRECTEKLKSGSLESLETAISYYAVNRLSYNGLGEIGRFSKSSNVNHWREDKILALRDYVDLIKNWRITNLDYREVVHAPAVGQHPFIFADPPYDIKQRLYYGHAEFDHDAFAVEMSKAVVPTLITYNYSEANLKRFSGWNTGTLNLTYTGANLPKKRRALEYMFFNYPLPGTTE